MQQKLSLKSPIYIGKDAEFQVLAQKFRTGYSHLAIICDNEDAAIKMRELHERVTEEIINQKDLQSSLPFDIGQILSFNYKCTKDHDECVSGILTSENVIEHILQTDIHDERDRANAISAMQKSCVITNSGDISSQFKQQRLLRAPSLRYRFTNASDEMSSSQVWNIQ